MKLNSNWTKIADFSNDFQGWGVITWALIFWVIAIYAHKYTPVKTEFEKRGFKKGCDATPNLF